MSVWTWGEEAGGGLRLHVMDEMGCLQRLSVRKVRS